jgi:hypothetical protein
MDIRSKRSTSGDIANRGCCFNTSLDRVKKLLLLVVLFYLKTLSLYSQSTSPAMLTYDNNGNSALAIPGQGTQFDLHTASTVFNRTRDDQMVLGYNTQPNGARYNNSEPQIRLALESNYNDGFAHYLEWNLDTASADLTHARRWMYLKVNRSSPLTGNWAFWGEYFSLQNYNSSANDVPSEYFTVSKDGIARLTSRPGQPAQMQLNTTDNSGSPGAYASFVFQRGYQTTWTITNKGGNGDTLSIAGTKSEVASFTQGGLFTSKGQRISVTTTISAYTAAPSDAEIRANCTMGPITITLPAANATGQTYRVIKIDSTGNAVRIIPAGGAMIDGAASTFLTKQYSGVTLIDGAAGAWDKY